MEEGRNIKILKIMLATIVLILTVIHNIILFFTMETVIFFKATEAQFYNYSDDVLKKK